MHNKISVPDVLHVDDSEVMDMDTFKKALNEIEEENKTKYTKAQIKKLKAIRRNPKKFLNRMKNDEYFKETKHIEVITKALQSGLGRKLRRSIAKRINMKWVDYLEAEDTIIEANTKSFNNGVLTAWIDRKKQEYSKGLINATTLNECIDMVTNATK